MAPAAGMHIDYRRGSGVNHVYFESHSHPPAVSANAAERLRAEKIDARRQRNTNTRKIIVQTETLESHTQPVEQEPLCFVPIHSAKADR